MKTNALAQIKVKYFFWDSANYVYNEQLEIAPLNTTPLLELPEV